MNFVQGFQSSFTGIALLFLLVISPIALVTVRLPSTSADQPSSCLATTMSSVDVNQLVKIATSSREFQHYAAGAAYSLSALGMQVGESCTPIIMLTNQKGDSIETIFSTSNSIAMMTYIPKSNVTFGVSNYHWSGWEQTTCSGNP